MKENLLTEKDMVFLVLSYFHGTTPLTFKFVKMPKKSAIFDHMLLACHKANFDSFSTLLKDNNAFNRPGCE